MDTLDGKVSIVTGGSSGIGEATVRLFVEQGSKVVIADIDEDRGKRLAAELGSNVMFQYTDVSKESDVAAVVKETCRKFDKLDCMVNNAGIAGTYVRSSIQEIPVDDFDQTVAVDIKGVFLGMKHAAQVMVKQGYGSIVTTASVAGFRVGYAPHVYSMAKAAVIHLTRSVAMELGEYGVRVNCVCPGAIVTPIFAKSLGLDAETADQTLHKLTAPLSQAQPIKRAGMPIDIAQAILWLSTDNAGFVNGHALVLDGGLSGGQPWSNLQSMLDQFGSLLGAP